MSEPKLTRGDIERIADERVARALRLLAAKHYVDKDLAHDGEPITPFDCEDLADDMDELVAARLTAAEPAPKVPSCRSCGDQWGLCDCGPAPEEQPADRLSASEAVYAFAGWITTRSEAVTASAKHDAAPWATLAEQFCQRHALSDPRNGWEERIIPDPTSPDPLPPLDVPNFSCGQWWVRGEGHSTQYGAWATILREERAAREQERAEAAALIAHQHRAQKSLEAMLAVNDKWIKEHFAIATDVGVSACDAEIRERDRAEKAEALAAERLRNVNEVQAQLREKHAELVKAERERIDLRALRATWKDVRRERDEAIERAARLAVERDALVEQRDAALPVLREIKALGWAATLGKIDAALKALGE